MQFLQRFYFPKLGQITINGIDIKDFDLHYLRSSFGVVSQEPVLFNGSFKDNIIYNAKDVSEGMMIEAAKKASAYSFIMGDENLDEEG